MHHALIERAVAHQLNDSLAGAQAFEAIGVAGGDGGAGAQDGRVGQEPDVRTANMEVAGGSAVDAAADADLLGDKGDVVNALQMEGTAAVGGHKQLIVVNGRADGRANGFLVEAQVEHSHQMSQLVLTLQLLVEQPRLKHGLVHAHHVFVGVLHFLGFTSEKFWIEFRCVYLCPYNLQTACQISDCWEKPTASLAQSKEGQKIYFSKRGCIYFIQALESGHPPRPYSPAAPASPVPAVGGG